MKKLLSVLFSVAFLLIFASFFSQKTFAGTQCTAAGGSCINLNLCGSANDLKSLGMKDCATGTTCCQAINAGACSVCSVKQSNGLYLKGGACGTDKQTLCQCSGSGTTTSNMICTYGCQVNSSTYDTCKAAPPTPACTVNWGTFPANIAANTTYTAPITITSNFGINHPAVYIAPGGSSIFWDQTALSTNSWSGNLKLTGYPAGTFTLKPYLNNSAGVGVECSPEKSFVSGCAVLGQRCGNNNLQCCSGAGTCTSPSAGGPETTCQLGGGPSCTGTVINGGNGVCKGPVCPTGTAPKLNASGVDIYTPACGTPNAEHNIQCCFPTPPPPPSTCTPSTGTCTGANSCSTTGAKTVVTCSGGVSHSEQVVCTLTPASTCNQPTAPVASAPTCDVATPTSEKLTWTINSANTTETLLYYCDKTKAAAHSPAVSCTRDAQATTDNSQAGWYLLPNNTAANFPSPQTLSGLTAGHNYTAFVRAFNGSHTASGTQHADSSDVNFTAGDCATTQPGLALTIGLDGIGTTGDQVNADYTTKTNTAIINGQTVTNPVAGSNQTPVNTTREVTLTLTDTTSNAVTTAKGNVSFETTGTNKGKYTGIVPYGTTVKAGTYTVKVTVDAHLTKLVPGNITIANTTTTVNVPSVNLVAGDIDESNTLSGTDYNILLSCMADPDINNPVSSDLCNTAGKNYKTLSDLEDNGPVNKFDYNLFLREFSKVQTGD